MQGGRVYSNMRRMNTMRPKKTSSMFEPPRAEPESPSLVSRPDPDSDKVNADKLVTIIKLLLDKFITDNYEDNDCKDIMLKKVNSLHSDRTGNRWDSKSTSTQRDSQCTATGIETQVNDAFIGLETFFSNLINNESYTNLLLEDSVDINSIMGANNVSDLNGILQLNKNLYPTQEFTQVMMDYINHLFNSGNNNPLPPLPEGGKHNKKHGKSKKHKKSKKSRGKKRRTMRR